MLDDLFYRSTVPDMMILALRHCARESVVGLHGEEVPYDCGLLEGLPHVVAADLRARVGQEVGQELTSSPTKMRRV